MTVKEKAQELYFKYYMQVADGSFPEYNAKQCALIAVDEIIKTFDCTTPQSIEYWEQVKHELTKQQEL